MAAWLGLFGVFFCSDLPMGSILQDSPQSLDTLRAGNCPAAPTAASPNQQLSLYAPQLSLKGSSSM